MPEITQCPQCQRKLNVPDAQIGQTVRCPLCGEEFTAAVLNIQRPPPAAPLEREPLSRGRDDDLDLAATTVGYEDFRRPSSRGRTASRRRRPGPRLDRHVYVFLRIAGMGSGRNCRVDGRDGLAANGSRDDGQFRPRFDSRRSGLRDHRPDYFHPHILVRLPGQGRPNVIRERNDLPRGAKLRGTAALAPRSWPQGALCNRSRSTPKAPCRFHRGSGRAGGRPAP